MLLPSTVALTGWHLSPCTMTLVTTTTTSQAPTTRHLEAYLGAFAEFTDLWLWYVAAPDHHALHCA